MSKHTFHVHSEPVSSDQPAEAPAGSAVDTAVVADVMSQDHPTVTPLHPDAMGTEAGDQPAPLEHLQDVLETISLRISPVWPLKDYVAVNPYHGFANRDFWATRRFLRLFSDCETLPPLSHYRYQFRNGGLTAADVETAIGELHADGFAATRDMTADQIVRELQEDAEAVEFSPAAACRHAVGVSNPERRVWTMAESIDRFQQTDWNVTIVDEIGKHCAAHYDDGQASWSAPYKNLPLYQAWRLTAQVDRQMDVLGLSNFCHFVKKLPHTPEAAITWLLGELNVPKELWKTVLLCQAMTVPGWSAWAKYQQVQAERSGQSNDDLVGLLAMRLAYDVAIAKQCRFETDWSAAVHLGDNWYSIPTPDDSCHEALTRLVALRATEVAYRRVLLSGMQSSDSALPTDSSEVTAPSRPSAQAVFCIDVRSERLRRHLESVNAEVQTFGFAGFFGMPIRYTMLGESSGSTQVPALIGPSLEVHEGCNSSCDDHLAGAMQRRGAIRDWRRTWKQFQRSAVGGFGFVETVGLWFGVKMLKRTLGWSAGLQDAASDGMGGANQESFGPVRDDWETQGFGLDRQADLAESMLRGIGITDCFARLVVLCGHGSQTENNPLQAGLDCGACGGHSGAVNARVAAMLCNDPAIRQALADRGIAVPEDTYFLPALHNTTTDEVTALQSAAVPDSHKPDVDAFLQSAGEAGAGAAAERVIGVEPIVSASKGVGDVAENSGEPVKSVDRLWKRRSQDWSEVRPEWGLAGNTSFVVAPRHTTRSTSLAGRSFLHSYDYRQDPEGAILEQIMTAPMVVAHWISQQYNASTVDPNTFGSGTKTLHNVVGKMGVFSGNGGDLMTGLPWQSLHDGKRLQHEPVRLQVVIAAPRGQIESIIAKHTLLDDLLSNGWLHLVAQDDGEFHRYTLDRRWETLVTA